MLGLEILLKLSNLGGHGVQPSSDFMGSHRPYFHLFNKKNKYFQASNLSRALQRTPGYYGLYEVQGTMLLDLTI